MGIKTILNARQASNLQSKGDVEGAIKLYQKALDEGLTETRYILSYSVLLLRTGKFQEARELLVKFQKAPMTEDQRVTLHVNYACAVYKLGDLQKAIDVLERIHAKSPCGIVYETLGYLYIEAGDAEKALAYNQEALEYDDEDTITLDNLAQTYYRLKKNKSAAKEYFDKAHALKPAQIDTLYFLAQYDKEDGNKDAAKQKLETILKGRFSPLNFASKEKVDKLLAEL